MHHRKSMYACICICRYQAEMLEQAQEKNVIAYLGTNSGKTRIATKLIEWSHMECEFGFGAEDRQIAVFLAPTVQLVLQVFTVSVVTPGVGSIIIVLSISKICLLVQLAFAIMRSIFVVPSSCTFVCSRYFLASSVSDCILTVAVLHQLFACLFLTSMVMVMAWLPFPCR